MKAQQLKVSTLAAAVALLFSHTAQSQSVDLTEFQNSIRAQHNGKRVMHYAPSLTHNNNLSSDAQLWAEHLLSTGRLEHDTNRGNTGENLFMSVRSLPPEPPMSKELIALYQQYYPNWEPAQAFTGSTLANDVAAAWYNEVQNYDYATAGSINGSTIGHFTQMVWRDTTELGCGAASKLKPNNMVEVYVVCRYQAPGNYVGMYHSNVLQP